jgi:hypothetical protein
MCEDKREFAWRNKLGIKQILKLNLAKICMS